DFSDLILKGGSDGIRKIWILDNLFNSKPLAGKKILPNGCFNLAFIFGQGLTFHVRDQSYKIKEGVYLCGQFSSQISVEIEAHTKVSLAQLYPWTLSLFGDASQEAHKDRLLPLEEIIGKSRLRITPAELLCEHCILKYLYELLSDIGPQTHIHPFLQEACLLLKNAQGNLSIQHLSQGLRYSSRFVEKKFKNYVGLSPKEFSRILRVRSIIDELKLHPQRPHLTDLGLKYGFYDQAHFIKTFRQVLNISPKEFKAPNYILPLRGVGF
ncbi:MAG: helix-turn-helix transcriptional regulator, partial [Bacteroidota bacterium]